MMLLGVEARVKRTRKRRRREKCVFEWHNMKVSERERLGSEKDISFRCETIIRGCSFEYINIAFDIGILKSFRIINTSCVDNVWEIIVLFPTFCLFCHFLSPFSPCGVIHISELELQFSMFREKKTQQFELGLWPRVQEGSIVEMFEFFLEKSICKVCGEKICTFPTKRKSSENFSTNFCSLECLRYSYCCIYSTAIKYTFLLCFQHETTHKLRFHIGSICSGIDREEKLLINCRYRMIFPYHQAVLFLAIVEWIFHEFSSMIFEQIELNEN